MDIKQQFSIGKYERKIYLPSEDFVYGMRNRTPTPIKLVVNYDYSREAEAEIRQEYEKFMENVILISNIFYSFQFKTGK